MATTIPKHLLQDRYWGSMIYLFTESGKLNALFTTKYFDFEGEIVKVQALRRATSGWSQSEKFLMKLALHLFNDSNKVDLGGMDYLDSYNKSIALKAIQLRYQ